MSGTVGSIGRVFRSGDNRGHTAILLQLFRSKGQLYCPFCMTELRSVRKERNTLRKARARSQGSNAGNAAVKILGVFLAQEGQPTR